MVVDEADMTTMLPTLRQTGSSSHLGPGAVEALTTTAAEVAREVDRQVGATI